MFKEIRYNKRCGWLIIGNEDLYKSALVDYLYYCIANINK